MSVVSTLHEVLAWVAIVAGAVVGTWTAAAHWVEGLRAEFIWRANAAFHIAIVVQVALGGIIVGFGDVDGSQDHMFYGFLTFAGVGIIVGYRHLSQYRYLLYGLGGLFVMGLAIRALLFNPLAG